MNNDNNSGYGPIIIQVNPVISPTITYGSDDGIVGGGRGNRYKPEPEQTRHGSGLMDLIGLVSSII